MNGKEVTAGKVKARKGMQGKRRVLRSKKNSKKYLEVKEKRGNFRKRSK